MLSARFTVLAGQLLPAFNMRKYSGKGVSWFASNLHKAFVSVFVLFLGCNVFAASYCVGPSATGSGSGADWSNRIAWSAITFVRGNTYYLSDGTYSGRTFSTPESGTNVITIKKAIASDHVTDTGWNTTTMGSGQAVWSSENVFTSGFWTFDGQTGAGFSVAPPDTTPANYGFNMSLYSANSLSTGSYNPIRNLQFRHIYASVGTNNNTSAAGWFISNRDTGLSASNLVVSHCLLVGYNQALREYSANWNDVTWEYNNYLWMQSSTDLHGNPINVIWSVSTNMTVRYSLFYRIWASASRSGLSDCISGNGGSFYGLKVYGCVFDGAQSGDPVIGAFKGGTGGPDHGYVWNCRIYNNTFLNTDAGYSGGSSANGIFGSLDGGSGNLVQNNLMYNTVATMGYCTHDYNQFVYSVATWVGGEANGVYVNNVSTVGNAYAPSNFDVFKNWAGLDYTLKANTPAGNSLGAEYSKDALGNTRTTWTRGAFEFGSGVRTNAAIFVSPGSLDFGVIAAGTTRDQTLTVQNVGGGTLSGTATVAAPFTIVAGGTYSLGSNQSQVVTVRYNPTAAGNYSGSLTFTGGGGSVVGVSGVAYSVLPGLSFAADAGIISAPFVSSGGIVSQSVDTGVSDGGRAVYTFTITNAGDYLVQAIVNAPSAAENSFFVNIDAEPTDPQMIWHVPVNGALQMASVSWQGSGTYDAPEFAPKVFTLQSGTHQLFLRGRERNTQLQSISLLRTGGPTPPSNLRIASAP